MALTGLKVKIEITKIMVFRVSVPNVVGGTSIHNRGQTTSSISAKFCSRIKTCKYTAHGGEVCYLQ